MKIYRTKILPIAFCFAISLAAGNKAYIYLSVSFIQVVHRSTSHFDCRIYCLTHLTHSKYFHVKILCIPHHPHLLIFCCFSLDKMLKAFTPVSVLFLSFLSGLESPSVLQVLIVLLICVGVTISAVGELKFNLVGFALQAAGIFSESVRLVLADRFLKDLKLDPLSTLFYVAPPSFAFILVGFMALEYDSFPVERLFTPFAGILLLNGFAAFALNVRTS